MTPNNLYDYSILVVIYNQTITDSDTLNSLLANKLYISNSKVTVWDNSPKSLDKSEQEYLNENIRNLTYIHTPENYGLAKIYNSVIVASNDSRYVIILDQDSEFNNEYFEKLHHGITQYPYINLLVPLIKHKNLIMSPGYYKSFKGSLRKTITLGKLSTKDMAVITSGMVISQKYLRETFKAYDESFVFYGIDTYFSIKYRETNSFFYLFDCDFKHDLAVTSSEGYKKKLWRFQSHRRATYLLSKRNIITYITGLPYLLYITIKFYLLNKEDTSN